VDDELERLKATTPVDACTLLTPEKLKSVLPKVNFELVQRLEPRLSGYAWDSRCTYGAGRGSIEFAKEQETHRVEFYVYTRASAEKAEEGLVTERKSAESSDSFSLRPELGKNAYSFRDLVGGTVHFVRGQSEMKMTYRELYIPGQEQHDMVSMALALAKAL